MFYQQPEHHRRVYFIFFIVCFLFDFFFKSFPLVFVYFEHDQIDHTLHMISLYIINEEEECTTTVKLVSLEHQISAVQIESQLVQTQLISKDFSEQIKLSKLLSFKAVEP